MTKREASPTVDLQPGDYIVNAAFGRADITRKITVTSGTATSEKFVLNAGGLKVKALVDGVEPPPNTVAYDILSSERDQLDNRVRVLGGARPNVINRLNAGIYRIVSRYGDANAKVEADVTVEAGKLTEATVSHSAARVTFKLVDSRRRRGAARYAVDGADAGGPGRDAERRRAADAHPRARHLLGDRQIEHRRLQARLYARQRRGGAGRSPDAVSAASRALEVGQHPIGRTAVAPHARFDGVVLADPAAARETASARSASARRR